MIALFAGVVLVDVVNPQSFHWTMDLLLPWTRLAALCGAVMVAGTLTAWLAARQAAGAITLMAPLLRAQGQEQALIHMAVVAAARISRQLILR